MTPSPHSFTRRYSEIETRLITLCGVSASWDPSDGAPQPPALEYRCLWDTGADISAITRRVANDLALTPEAWIQVHHAGGISDAVPQYNVNIQLPSNLKMNGRAVAQLEIGSCDVLVGMDIISLGDFALSNFNGRTTFTFRIPSVAEIDFDAD